MTVPIKPAGIGSGSNRQILAQGAAAAVFLLIVIVEMAAPANVVVAYGFVLPILLVATARNRRLMVLTVALCILVTYVGLLRPTKPGRFVSAVINRSVVVGVLMAVAYFAMTREERKAREEATRAELALQSERLLKANTQLVEMKDALNRAERLAALGQLVASVAHEVGTPLHSIAWHVQEVAEEPGITPAMRKRIDIIDSQISRVVRIIQDLLSATRQRKPALAWLPVDRLVRPVAALMEPSFVGKGVALSVNLGPEPLALWGDVEPLQQVLLNLMSNALAATGRGGDVEILAGSRPTRPAETESQGRIGLGGAERMITLIVQDNGCGMPAEHLARVFEPFFTTKAIGDGTGLGLFLSHEIVTAHGGSLSIESAIGEGTTVVIALPAATEEQVAARSEQSHEA